MQHWALILAAYQYQLQFRSTDEYKNTDMLSRLPLKEDFTASEEPIFSITCVDILPVTSRQIAEATRKDPVMSRVLSHTLNGWPAHNSDRDVQPYFDRRTELSFKGGVVLWGLRVVVPPAFRDRLLEELHDQHPGIYRMKALACSYVWWPNIDTDIEGKVKTGHDCTRVCNTPPTAPLQPWWRPHDLGRECILTMPSIKGNISLWPLMPTPSGQRSSPQQRQQQRRPSAFCVTFSLPMAFQKK